MASTGLDVFDTTIEKTNRILGGIEDRLGWEGRRNQAYLALRTVLHALRDRLVMDDAMHFAAQLPLLLKGTFFDGWKPDQVPIKMNRDEFEQYVASQFRFDVEGGIDDVIRAVIDSVFETIDPGEADKIIQALPKDITAIFCAPA